MKDYLKSAGFDPKANAKFEMPDYLADVDFEIASPEAAPAEQAPAGVSLQDMLVGTVLPFSGKAVSTDLVEGTALDAVPRAAQAGLVDIGADLMFRDIDAEEAERTRLAAEQKTIAESSLPKPLAKLLYTDPISPVVAKAGAAIGGTETYRNIFGSLSEYVTNAREQVESEVASTIEQAPIRGRIERAATDFSGSVLSSAASIPGGGFAAIPAAITKNDAYRAAREAGASAPDAEEYASYQAAAEGGISAIPTGKLLSVLGKPFVKSADSILAKRIPGFVPRTLATSAGESAEEAATTAVQEGIDLATAMSDSSVAPMAEKQRAKTLGELGERAGRAAAAGAVGGAIAAPKHYIDAAVEKGMEAGRTLRHAEDEFLKQVGDARKQADLAEFDAAQEQVNLLEKEVAFDQAEQDAAQQKADEEEAAFRTMEKEREFQGKTRVEEYAGVTERVPVQPPGEVTPEQVKQERETDRAIQDETTRRLQEDMARMDAEEAAKAEPAPAPEKPKRPRAKKPEPKPVEPLIGTLEEETVLPTDKAVREMAKAAGLKVTEPDVALAQKQKADTKPSIDLEDYKAKLNTFVGGLAKKNTQQATDARSLIHQRKLVVAPNPESIGRQDSGDAMYDPKTGKMYVYLDRINPEDAVGSIAATVHEATHGGQFNERQGRGRVLESIFAKSPVSKLKNQIKSAYGKNALATAAVDAAAEARATYAKEHPHLTDEKLDELEGLELMAYFAGEAQKPGSKGRLRGVADGMVAGVRGLLRSAGVDMEVTLNDAEAATRKVIGELVKTDTKPLSDNEAEQNLNEPALQMIAGPKSAGFAKAKEEGLTYKGFVDQKDRYEIPDVKSELKESGIQALEAGDTIPLSMLLDHPQLLENYPQLRGVNVKTGENLVGDAQYNSNTKLIQIHPLNVAKAAFDSADMEELRNLVLHETQHAVQDIEGFVGGSNTHHLIPKDIRQNKDDATREFRRSFEKFELNLALSKMNAADKAAWDNEVKAFDLTNEDALKRHFLSEGYFGSSESAAVEQQGKRWAKAKATFDAVNAKFKQAEDKAFRDYLRDYGEAEARNTELRSRTAEDLTKFIMPEETIATDKLSKDKNISKKDLLNTDEALRTKGHIADSYVPLAMADGSKSRPAAPDPKLSEKERVRRVVEFGTRSRTADLKFAEDLDTQYKAAMKADKKDINNPRVHKEIVNLLTAVDNENGPRRTALWKEFQKKYPNTSKVLAAMRDRMDQSAKEFLESKLTSGKELNKTEIKEVMEVMTNMNRYLPRAFSALQPNVGKQWAGRRLQDYLNTKPTGNFVHRLGMYIDRLGRKGNPQTKKNIEIVKEGIQYFEKHFVIPPNDVLTGMSIKDLVRMYEDHVGPIRTLRHDGTEESKKAALLDELDHQRKLVSPETLKSMAENAVREMLGLSEEPDSTASVKAFKKAFNETGKLGQEEKAIPDELAKLMGEIHDPAGRVLITLAKQSAYLARAKMLGELYNDYQGELVIPKARINEPGMREKFPKALNGQHYGPLDGFYATDSLAEKLKGTYETFNTFDDIMNTVFAATSQLTRKEKISGIIIDPINWATNFTGSGITLLMNGNTSPIAMGRGLQTARDYLYGTMKDGTTKMLDDAQRYLGIEAVEAAEIQHILGDKLKQYLDGKMDGHAAMKLLSAAVAPERTRAGRVVIAGYAITDAWAKIANFHDRIRVLDNYYKALGQTKSIEEIKREAGADASFTNFSAERVPKALTFLDRKGLTKFAGYFAESFRTPVANYIQAYIDIQRAMDTKKLGGPKADKAATVLAVSAAKRLTGNALATLVMPAQLALRYNQFAIAAGLGASFLLAGDDDDDELKRLMVSEWNRNGDLINFGMDKNGQPVFYNASAKMDPIGPSTDLIRDITYADDIEQAGEAIRQDIVDLVISANWMKRAYKAFTLPKVPESELAATFPDAADGFRDAVESGGFNTSTANKAMYVVSPFLPGIVKSWNPKYVPQMKDDKTAEVMAKFGADFEVLDPNKTMRQYGFEAKENYDAARKHMADSLSSRNTLKDEHLLNAAVRYAAEYKVQQTQDHKYVTSLRAWGYDDAEIVELFKNNGWSKKHAQRLVDGETDIPLSLKSFKEVTRLQKQNTSDEDKQEQLDERFNQVEDWVDSHKKELEKMGIEVTE